MNSSVKILHIINNLASGGAEKLILETLPFYRKNGIDVSLILLNNNKPAFYDELMKTACCPVHILSKSSVYNPLLCLQIIPFLRKSDIVHVHLFPSLYWVALAKVLCFSHVRLYFTEHGTTNRRWQNLLFKPLDKFIYAQYDKIIAISDSVGESLRSYLSIKDNKIRIIKNGINLEKIRTADSCPKSDFFHGENLIVIIQVSRFHEPKDQTTAIRSMIYLPDHVKLLLVGEGELLPHCQELVKELNLEGRIAFTGLRLDVPRLLKMADIVVLSSKHEGLSLASLEGMASGRPFVASDVPGLRELVKDAGILFPQGNPRALANKIMKLLSDKLYYNQVADSCMKRASEFDIEHMVKNYIDLWQQLSE